MSVVAEKMSSKEAVFLGIKNGWTAKETAYNTGLTLRCLQECASRMRVAFAWSRIGPVPKNCNSPISFKTALGRERRTIREVSTMLQKTIRKMDSKDPVALELMRAMTYIRSRHTPPSFLNRVRA